MAYESFVGQRYLMAKRRSRVLSIITLIAVGGVGLGVTALIVVLSVMGGFTEDLTSKILGARAHIVIQDPGGDPLMDAAALADEAATFEGVEGASPFIESEVMVSSPTNLSGVILRGVDVDRVRDVSMLLRELEEGELDFLRDDSQMMEEVQERRVSEAEDLLDHLSGAGDDDLESVGDIQEREAEEDPQELFPAPEEGGLPPLPDFDDEDQADPADQGEESDDGFGAMPSLFDDGDDPFDLPELPSLDDEDDEMPPIFDTGGSAQVEGRSLPGIVIGTELATSLRVRLGDEINVVTPQGDMGPTGPIPRSRPFRVVGIFYSGMYEYDANHAYTALSDATRLFDVAGPTGVELRAHDVEASVSIAEALREAFSPELEVLDWQELNSSLFFALRLERIAMFVILTFIILVASFSIVAMLIMIVIEKAREIAILKSMGASNGGIMRIFIYQGLVIGTSGALLGLGAGLGICYVLATVGLPLDPDVYYITTVPVDINPVEVTAVVICAVAISFLATLYPSYQAARLNPVEGLRND